MKTFKAISGAEVMIAPAPWEEAGELKNVLVSASVPLEKVSFTEQSVKDFLHKFLVYIDATPRFQEVIWPCLQRCTRDNKKITKQTFDELTARADYYEIVEACVELNTGPFLDRIFLPFIAKAVPAGA